LEFHDLIKILLTSLFILPGFLLSKIREKVEAFDHQNDFSATTYSLGISIIIFFLWLFFNFLYENYFSSDYHFSIALKHLVDSNNSLKILLSPKAVIAISFYALSFLLCGYFLFVWYWSSFGYILIYKFIGFTKKTKGITPWDDLPSLTVSKWVAIETNDSRIIMGQVLYISHRPYPRELIISGSDEDTIHIYENKEEINYSDSLEYIYLNDENIRSIQIHNTGLRKFLKINRKLSKNKKRRIKYILLRIYFRIIKYIRSHPFISFPFSIIMVFLLSFLTLSQAFSLFFFVSIKELLFFLVTAFILILFMKLSFFLSEVIDNDRESFLLNNNK